MTTEQRGRPWCRGRFPRRLVTGMAAGLVVCAFPTVAGATDYCVDTVAACGPKNVAGFQDALDKAAATSNADRIFLGATTYTAPIASGFTYEQQAGPVEIVGAGGGGPTPTIVTSPAGGNDRVLRLMGGPGTSIHDVQIELPKNILGSLRGLWTNGTARRIRVVDADPSQTTNRIGVVLTGGALEDSDVLLGTNSDGVNLTDGAPTVRSTTVSANIGISTNGGLIERTWVGAATTGVVLQRNKTTIRSSKIAVQGASGTGLYAIVQPGFDTTVVADGLDLIGSGDPGAIGVRASTAYAPLSNVTVTLRNSLLRDFPKALYADTLDSGIGRIDAAYSDYDASKNIAVGANAKITQVKTSNFGNAGFADVADRDYRLLPSSPLVDAGDPAATQGLDLLGSPLVADGNLDGIARRDIGAFELPGPVPGVGNPGPTGGGGGFADREAPLVSSFFSSNRLFAVGRAGTAMSAAAARGTRFRYKLSESARVTIAIQRALPGRKRHGSCVRPSLQLRQAKRCTRYRTIGRLTRTAKQGSNSIKFTGRLGSRALRPGRYRAVARATDAAGNRSAPKRARFRIVHR